MKCEIFVNPICSCGLVMAAKTYADFSTLASGQTHQRAFECFNRRCANFGKLFRAPILEMEEIRQ